MEKTKFRDLRPKRFARPARGRGRRPTPFQPALNLELDLNDCRSPPRTLLRGNSRPHAGPAEAADDLRRLSGTEAHTSEAGLTYDSPRGPLATPRRFWC